MRDSYAKRPPRLELPGGRIAEWRLRELMAGKGLFSAVQLQQALAGHGVTLGASQAHELLTRAPRQPHMMVLFALCGVLDCTLADLWVVGQAAATPAEGQGPARCRSRERRRRPARPRGSRSRRSALLAAGPGGPARGGLPRSSPSRARSRRWSPHS